MGEKGGRREEEAGALQILPNPAGGNMPRFRLRKGRLRYSKC